MPFIDNCIIMIIIIIIIIIAKYFGICISRTPAKNLRVS